MVVTLLVASVESRVTVPKIVLLEDRVTVLLAVSVG